MPSILARFDCFAVHVAAGLLDSHNAEDSTSPLQALQLGTGVGNTGGILCKLALYCIDSCLDEV